MNCVELHESLAESDNADSTQQKAHLRACAACSALVADLHLIATTAAELREANEPSPRVWNSIEIILRQEGLIHPPRANRPLIPFVNTRWVLMRWMLPAAAALLIALGISMRQHSSSGLLSGGGAPVTTTAPASPTLSTTADLNDDDLIQELSSQVPQMKAEYKDNLRLVNASIQDARSDVEANPNDEEARRSLLEAYEQKAMLFEMATDRSLP